MTAVSSQREPAVLAFAYHRSVGPMLGVLLGIAVVETMMVHLIALGLWGWKVAAALALIDLSAIVWLVRLMRSFRRLPATIEGDRLTMRVGTLRSITIAVENIAGFRETFDAAAIKRRDVANLALIAWPNILIDLKHPIEVRHRRIISAIAHRLDDPAAFHAAIAQLERAHGYRREPG
ncbi:MAG: hypothetical protein JWO65_1980 [Sphingomonas bacterium]|nr:hypothetical protein [Sphingomonas bacterium]